MRVLVVEDELHLHGGQERCLLEYTERLAERGHQIDLLYRSPGETLPEYRRFCREMRRIPGHLLDAQHPIQSITRWLRSLRMVAPGQNDIVYINQHQDSPFGAVLAKLCRLPLVCHLHQPPPAGRGIQWALARPAINRYIAVSRHTRAQYVARGVAPTRIDVVYNGIDLDRYRPPDRTQIAATRRSYGISPEAFVVLYAGRLDPEKGIEVLIDAFNLLDLAPDEGRLIIAGAPRNHRSAAAAQAYVTALQTRSRSPSTLWLGRQTDMPVLYGTADVAVLPSLIDEPLGRTTLEAMACERPALVSAVGACSEVLWGQFTRHIVPPANPSALASALAGLRQWQEREPKLGADCREHVRANFPMERAVDGVEMILQRVIHEERPPLGSR